MRHRHLLLLPIVAGLLAVVVPARAAAPSSSACSALRIPVALGEGQPATETIAATLCEPVAGHAPTVHLLLAGSTYGQWYWDFPYQPEHYSYVRALNTAGVATLAIDRFGSGTSSLPLSALVTIDSETFVAHQLVRGLRAGTIGGHSFERVVGVGNSSGSFIAMRESVLYDDLDGVIVTGIVHRVDPTSFAVLAANHQPALLDPRLAARGPDAGYSTFTHRQLMHGPNVDPTVVELDESLREAVSLPSQATLLPGIASIVAGPELGPPLWYAAMGDVAVPVLVVAGARDAIFCTPLAADCANAAAVRALEAPFYRSTPRLDVFVQPGAGHVNSIEPNATSFYAAAAAWTADAVGI